MYQALYRKYRPVDFDSVIGQDAIVKTLKNSIIQHNFSHAYLFFGPRGTGKTSLSKIFARNINCLDSKDGNACGKCDNCRVSFSKNCMDIIEIDAASNNGVDEIRDLKSKITLVPNELKYKVYIIDEVHMLSIGAFNALLKTLEEPPEHAIFILATTDPQKVPETIISRCQTFSFKRISTEVIRKRLEYVCQKEKIDIDGEVLENISLLAEGGMRDALGFLDKLVSYTDKKITMDDFIEVNGTISYAQLKEFLSAILNGEISQVLSSINDFDNSGKNLIQIFTQLLNYSRNLIVDYYTNNTSTSFDLDLLQKFTNSLNEKMFDIKKSGNTRIFIEMFLLKFMNDFVLKNEQKSYKISEKSAVEKNISKTEEIESSPVEEDDCEYNFSEEYGDDDSDDDDNSLEEDSFYERDLFVPKVLNIDEIMEVRINNALACADKVLLKEEVNLFEKFKDYTFDQEIGYIACSLLDSKIRAVSSQNIIISFEYDSNVKQNLEILDKIIDVYQKITNSNKLIAIISDFQWESIRKEYISNLKKGITYQVKEEPKAVLEERKKDDIIGSNAIELFGDIVEVE